jgi:hypothetical protein
LPYIPNYSDPSGNAHLFIESGESFGICPVSQEVIEKFNYIANPKNNEENEEEVIAVIPGKIKLNYSVTCCIVIFSQDLTHICMYVIHALIDIIKFSALATSKLLTMKLLASNNSTNNNI